MVKMSNCNDEHTECEKPCSLPAKSDQTKSFSPSDSTLDKKPWCITVSKEFKEALWYILASLIMLWIVLYCPKPRTDVTIYCVRFIHRATGRMSNLSRALSLKPVKM